MKKLLAFTVVWFMLTSSAISQSIETHGSLVIIGGALRFDQADVWSRIVALSGGEGAKIAVIPAACDDPAEDALPTVAHLKKLGANAFLVPVGHNKFELDYRTAVHDLDLVEEVRTSGGVYFMGGEQDLITKALYNENGTNSPMLDAIWEVYRRGGVVAGSSAGAAVMSRIMYSDAPRPIVALKKGVTMGKEIDHGLGFMHPEWFVEQHCLTRGRFARALVAMHSQGFKYGIGVDDNTALLVRNGTDVKVLGYKGAIVMDMTDATHDPSVKAFNLKNIKLTYLDRGDYFNLQTLTVSPSPEKLSGDKIEPASPDFKPGGEKQLFYNDILSNTTMIDLLGKLIESKEDEAIGLAFDGTVAARRSTRGFEFRFYRQSDTVGWYTEAFGSEDYTVANIYLDIRPITVVGPMYK